MLSSTLESKLGPSCRNSLWMKINSNPLYRPLCRILLLGLRSLAFISPIPVQSFVRPSIFETNIMAAQQSLHMRMLLPCHDRRFDCHILTHSQFESNVPVLLRYVMFSTIPEFISYSDDIVTFDPCTLAVR